MPASVASLAVLDASRPASATTRHLGSARKAGRWTAQPKLQPTIPTRITEPSSIDQLDFCIAAGAWKSQVEPPGPEHRVTKDIAALGSFAGSTPVADRHYYPRLEVARR